MAFLLLPHRWQRQPQGPVEVDWGNPLARSVVLAFNSAAPLLKRSTGARFATPFGVALGDATDNSTQLPRSPVVQSADVVTVQTLLYAASSPSGVATTRIFGTRGSSEGAAQRRGWEVSIDGGSFIDVMFQTFGASGSRVNSVIGSGAGGDDFVGKLLHATFEVTRSVGIDTALRCWLHATGVGETATIGTNSQAFADDTPVANCPEAGGKMAGFGAASDYKVLSVIARTGTITEAERREFYANPWQLFRPLQRRVWSLPGAASGGGITGTLAATEAGSDSAALAGAVIIAGTLGATESGTDSAAITGDVIVSGALAATEAGSDVAAFSGGAVVHGDLATTETGADTANLTGTVSVAGDLAATETAADQASIAGSVRIAGALAATEPGSDTAALTGAVRVSGDLAAVEAGSDTAAINGSGQIVTTGTLAAVETGSDVAALAGAVIVGGVVAATESGQDSAAMTGSVLVSGLLAALESSADSASLVGQIVVSGSLAAVEAGQDTAVFLQAAPAVLSAPPVGRRIPTLGRPDNLASPGRPANVSTTGRPANRTTRTR